MTILKVANDIEQLEEAVMEEEAARSRAPWVATGAGLGGAGGALGGAATGAGLGAGAGGAALAYGKGRQMLGGAAPGMTRARIGSMAKKMGVGGAVAGLGAGALAGGLAGKGLSYVPDAANYVYDNRGEIADGALDAGRSVVDAGKATRDYIRQ